MRRLLLYTLFILLSGDIIADSFRCGRKIIKPGDSGNMLVKKCGNPVRKYNSKESVNYKGRPADMVVSNWVYRRNGKKDMIVSVRSGAVIKIQVE